jgi:hypothetical protein
VARTYRHAVMAGLVPAIHAFPNCHAPRKRNMQLYFLEKLLDRPLARMMTPIAQRH